MIVGTAGHIDHGKTTLVKALTGIDTDRLIEEKRRGMTIELGFAQMLQRPVSDAGTANPSEELGISFIDVPGHEKLVRTMLAGASSIDFALLLIAADDGVMPQTLEHLNILSLLKIKQGCIIITKADKVDDQLIQQRLFEGRQLVDQYALGNYSIHVVSTHTGRGISELQSLLMNAALSHEVKKTQAWRHQGFRMGLDRAFSLDGIGTIVAGSINGGKVSIGDTLCLAHAPDRSYRVRSLQVHAKEVDEALSGQRCAIALVGLERSQCERGQLVCSPSIALSTSRLDAYIELSRLEKKSLRSGTIVHVHACTQEAVGSLAVLGKNSIEPGEFGFVQLILRRPMHLWSHDRVILRDAGASHTIGGGIVIEVQGLKRYRQTPERMRYLDSQLDENWLKRFFRGLVYAPFGSLIAQKLLDDGIDSRATFDEIVADGPSSDEGGQDGLNKRALLESTFMSQDRSWIIDNAALDLIKVKILKILAEHHEAYPDMLGILQSRVKSSFGMQMTEGLWEYVLDLLLHQELLRLKGGFLYLPEHGDLIRSADLKIAQRVLPLLDEAKFDPPWVRDLAKELNITEIQMRMALLRLSKMGDLHQIVRDLFYHPHQVQSMANIMRDIAQGKGDQHAKPSVSASEFRDATGLGRKRAIQILEFFDRIGFSRRLGDVHLIRTDNTLFANSST